MKLYEIAMIGLLLVPLCFSCVNKTDITIWEYENIYDKSGHLQMSFVKTFEQGLFRKKLLDKSEHVYYYADDGKLMRKEEYNLDEEKGRRMQYVEKLSDTLKESIYLNGVDTAIYSLDEFNKKSQWIRHISKMPESGDYVEWKYVYDSSGCCVQAIGLDYWRNRRTIRYFSVEGKSSLPQNIPDSISRFYAVEDVVSDTVYQEDTLIVRNYLNGKLDFVVKKIENKKQQVEMEYDRNNQLVMLKKIFNEGDKRIEIEESFIDHHHIDSIFYIKDKEVKQVSIRPAFKLLFLTDYDEWGNVVRQESRAKLLENQIIKD